jgi:hypothetical protein
VSSRLSFRGLAAGQCFARLGELFLAAVTWLENDLFGLGVDLERARKRERHLAADQKHQRPVRLYLDEVRTDVAEAERAITGGRSDSDVDGIQLGDPGPLAREGPLDNEAVDGRRDVVYPARLRQLTT